MRHIVRFLLAALIGGSAFAATLAPTGNSVPGEVLVKIQAGASSEDIDALESAHDIDKSDRISNLKSGTIWRMHSRSKHTDALTTALKKNPNVVYVEPNYIVYLVTTPNDTSYSQLWGLKNTGQTIGGFTGFAGADISAEAAWNVTTGSASIVVGVVDTGVDYNHPDLAANIWSNPGGKGNAGCAAGTHGYNAITKTCNPMDDHYHGTHVSGTIGAVGNNGLGVAGVNWTTSIMGLKFLSSFGSGTTADAITAIDFAVQAKIDGVNVRVLSNSWGGGGFSKSMLDEINKANENDILFVAAAGNSSSNNDVLPNYPSNYSTPNMIAVAATDNRDGMAYFSSYGLNSVHLGAPGVDVLSCYPGSGYTFLSGTSMATPHVAGVAALVLAHTPGLTTAQVKNEILNNTDPIASLSGKTITGGRLNAARAVGVPAGPGFTISASPTSRSVVKGASTTYNVTITPSNGFAGPVSLATGLPTGATGLFTPNPATTSSMLTVTTSGTTPLGFYTLVMTGVSGALTRSTSVTLTVAATPPPAACPAFLPPANYTVGSNPSAIATGDFNRDGKEDLAVANTSSNTISVLLGKADGTFNSPFQYSVASAPISLVAGDFNGDGKPDLAVANALSSSISILMGSGEGTFAPAVNYSSGSNPFWVAIGDFNRDGDSDLATANNGSSNVSILLGQGDGTFQAPVDYGAGAGAFWVAVGDFDADGSADLAVADHHAGKVSVLLGNGDGTFQAAVDHGVGSNPSSVAIGDVNGDGKADLAVSNYGSNNVSILAGNGNGTFQTAVNFAVANGPYSVAIVDINGDGKSDLAVANSNSNNVSVLLGTGNGAFQAAINYAVGTSPNHVVAGDFDSDGRPDLAVANVNSSNIIVLRNAGVCSTNCNTIAAAANSGVGTTPKSVAVGDFDGDGKTDLAVANSGTNDVSIRRGNGDGTFQAAVNYGADTAPDSVAIGDFNRDGKLDLAVANNDSSNVSILFGDSGGTFQAAVNYGSGTNPHSVAIGDFNGDGNADLAVANNGSSNASILLGNGTGTFQAAVNYGAGTNPEFVAVGDFNRDGKADLAVASSGSGNLSILLGNGDGTFQTATNVSAGTNPSSVAAGDFNRDGKTDLAVANSGSGNVSVLLGNGSGGFPAAVNYGAGTNPYSVAAGDFNDDGVLDLAVAYKGSNNVSILPGNGDGTFGAAANSGTGTLPYSIAIGDFNRDGKDDLAVANSGSNNVSILLNTCPAPDLTVTKTHSGSFGQGSTGETYTITVTNGGSAPTAGVVYLTDTLPVGLTATAMTGTGWTCSVATAICSRSDVLASGASDPVITLTVNVSSSAAATVTNTATASGGGELNSANSSATDPTTVTPVTDLIITKTHTGSFTQGATGRSYAITVRNVGGLATTGTITVTDTLPTGLTATAMSGPGWNCNLGSRTCTRSDALAGSTSYPVITLTVDVAADAAGSVTNTATVSGGGQVNTTNDAANDVTIIWSSETCATFGSPVPYSVGSSPYAIVLGDFNADGKSDLAATNTSSDSVSILIGNGGGTFAAAVNFAVGDYPFAIVLADFNGDGKADLAVANYYSLTVSVLIGNGNGTFATAVNYTVGSYARALTAGDFNGDGRADLAVASGDSSKVSILLGNGDGTMQTAVAYTVSSPYSVVTADFNGDGKADLAVTSYSSSTVFILRGNGDGTFQTAVSYPAGYGPISLAVGDFNSDGKYDLAVTNSYSNSISILLGNGDATFQAPINAATAYNPSLLAIEDVNGDGKADIAVASSYSNTVSLLLGNGNGTFQTAVNYAAGYGPSQVVISDFNSDGKADLAVTDNYDSRVAIMLGGCADLSIAKSHTGNFTGGQANATYSLTVSNVGGGATAGTVTVADILPNGLSATAISGSGWTCNLPSVMCTRTDSLATGSSYPVITLTVFVTTGTETSVTNTANVSGGGDNNSANNSASDPTTIVQVADLTIAKSHTGTFAQGQVGKTYTILVGNGGTAATSGLVTVTDSLPFGLTPTAMTGSGWNCNVNSLACSRSDALSVNARYPPITLTVNVNNFASSSLTNVASVSGGGESATGNNSATDPTVVLTTPANLVATAISTTQVSLTWNPVANATRYEVLRSSGNLPFTVVGAPLSNSFFDLSLTPNTTYLYEVRAADASATGTPGNLEMATTTLFTDDPIVVGTTTMKAVHVTELRTAINAIRAAAGQPPATFTDPLLTAGDRIKAIHLLELRSVLNAARGAVGLTGVAYTESALASGWTIKAVHIRELRAAVK